MSDMTAGLLFFGSLVIALAVVHRPLGGYLARVYADRQHWRAEKALYRLGGIDPDADQRWPVYLRAALAPSTSS